MKKILLSAVLLSGFSLLPYSCCLDENEWSLSGFDIHFLAGSEYLTGSVVDADTLSIELILHMLISSSDIINFGNSNGALYGWEDCHQRLINNYEFIRITSNNNYGGIPAGSSLNEFFLIDVKLNREIQALSVDTLPKLFLQKGASNEFFHLPLIYTIEKPAITDHIFTITLVDEAGNEVQEVAPLISWI